MNMTSTQGVDANINDIVTSENLNEVISFAKKFSQETGAVIAITGAIDIVVCYRQFLEQQPLLVKMIF